MQSRLRLLGNPYMEIVWLCIMLIINMSKNKQPALTAICTYFTRWLIRTTSLMQIHVLFPKSYVFYELHNLYEYVQMTYT